MYNRDWEKVDGILGKKVGLRVGSWAFWFTIKLKAIFLLFAECFQCNVFIDSVTVSSDTLRFSFCEALMVTKLAVDPVSSRAHNLSIPSFPQASTKIVGRMIPGFNGETPENVVTRSVRVKSFLG